MADRISLYISAALDLQIERDLLARAVAEIPVTLGWEINMTPHPGEPVQTDKAARADIHILLMGSDIRHQALLLLADHILDRSIYFALQPAELETLQSWREELESKGATAVEETIGGAGESSVILSTERYMPSEGVLIQPESESDSPE